MTTTKEQVLALVSAGKISAAEGDELLKAMKTARRSIWRLLTNPFERLSVLQTLLLGAGAAAGGLLCSRWNVRFDGALDVHIGPSSVSWREAVVHQLVAWPLTSLILWIAAMPVARQLRAIDFLGSVGVARLPLLAVGALAAAMRGHLPSGPSQVPSASLVALLVLAVLTIPAVLWMVAMLFQGFRTASGLRGAKCAVLFAVAVVLAEVLSKVVLQLAG